ncbi:hypothetical protein QI155_10800 [Thermodesulfovibrio sp. 1176]|uniref:hypothetical protein n=1 Tax=Thermodesulfovibrio sp. 1176 TaxID=3043424 RepID=UPI0024826056|nr:hypothetical protein [Thermodesulfovibrio sp. 1176]MDI1473020.1 hypothetical protein [Thermodesulfovibrio sp. 1176]
MKQIFLYLLALNLALLGAGATWLNSTNIEKLEEKDRTFVQSRRKAFNIVTFISLIISVTGLISSFIDETKVPSILGLISVIVLSVSALILGVLFIRLQKNNFFKNRNKPLRYFTRVSISLNQQGLFLSNLRLSIRPVICCFCWVIVS